MLVPEPSLHLTHRWFCKDAMEEQLMQARQDRTPPGPSSRTQSFFHPPKEVTLQNYDCGLLGEAQETESVCPETYFPGAAPPQPGQSPHFTGQILPHTEPKSAAGNSNTPFYSNTWIPAAFTKHRLCVQSEVDIPRPREVI